MRALLVAAACVSVLSFARTANAAPVCWPVSSGGNGHCYEVIRAPGGITWSAAQAAAQTRGNGWHLATITSAAENAFVYNLIKDDSSYWNCCLSGNSNGPWLGGFKTGPGIGAYAWVTGEPFLYTNWGPFEPFGNGDRISFFGYQAQIGPYWNDVPDSYPSLPPLGYVIERDDTSRLTISPPSGIYATTQRFDLVLIVEPGTTTITGGRATFNGTDVTTVLAACLISGTASTGATTLRCPGLSGALLGPGLHNFTVLLSLGDGSSIADTVNWEVIANSESRQ